MKRGGQELKEVEKGKRGKEINGSGRYETRRGIKTKKKNKQGKARNEMKVK